MMRNVRLTRLLISGTLLAAAHKAGVLILTVIIWVAEIAVMQDMTAILVIALPLAGLGLMAGNLRWALLAVAEMMLLKATGGIERVGVDVHQQIMIVRAVVIINVYTTVSVLTVAGIVI